MIEMKQLVLIKHDVSLVVLTVTHTTKIIAFTVRFCQELLVFIRIHPKHP